MRCPHCGSDNADNAPLCSACGASMAVDETEATVEELMRQVLTNDASEPGETGLHEGEEGRPASASVEAPSGEPDGGATSDEFERLSRHAAASVDETLLRPSAGTDEGGHLVVRATRDYDHDAQSANRVGPAENFETITDGETSRDTRRDPYARSMRTGDVLGEGNSRGRWRPLLAVLLVVALVGGGGAILAYGMELWGGKEVPVLVGESQDRAEARLRDKGLVARVEGEPADDAIGKVLAQEPDAGARVPEGSEVTIRVASARVVPNVVGLTEDEARAALEGAGAANITTVEAPSSAADGTVVAVSPEEGQGFVSRDEFVLTIAGAHHVPDVVGKREGDAVRAIDEMGLTSHVTYVQSGETARTVIETSPAAGEPIHGDDAIELKVSSPYPSDFSHLVEYFGHSSQDVDAYLLKEGFSFGKGFLDSHGNALQTYSSQDKGAITFSSQPYTASLVLPKEGSSNVLATGAPIAGVRLELPASMVPDRSDKGALEELAASCGFEGMSDFCDERNIALPSGVSRSNTSFGCASGREGDLVWTLLVARSDKSWRAVATCGREGLYPSSSLSSFGGSISDFVAYQEMYEVRKAASPSAPSNSSDT